MVLIQGINSETINSETNLWLLVFIKFGELPFLLQM